MFQDLGNGCLIEDKLPVLPVFIAPFSTAPNLLQAMLDLCTECFPLRSTSLIGSLQALTEMAWHEQRQQTLSGLLSELCHGLPLQTTYQCFKAFLSKRTIKQIVSSNTRQEGPGPSPRHQQDRQAANSCQPPLAAVNHG